jgi:hypothetical protein
MSKKSKRNRKNASSPISQQINLVDIDYEKLADAIVKAKQKVDISAKEDEKNQHNAWLKSVGFIEHSNVYKRTTNDLYCTLKIFAFPERYWKKEKRHVTNSIMTIIISSFFRLLELASFLVAAVILIGGIQSYQWPFILIYIVGSVVILAISRLFRFARYEVEAIKDENYLVELFSAITSFIALIVAALALYVGVMK